MKRFFAFVLAAGFGIGAAFVLGSYFQVSEVCDNGMLPSFAEGEHVLIERTCYEETSASRGDVVMVSNPIYAVSGENCNMLKRIIALPGDRVMITGGEVYVNNQVISEPYLFSERVSGEMAETQVLPGKVFVLGDNRSASTDSRAAAVGQIEIEDILGKVMYKW